MFQDIKEWVVGAFKSWTVWFNAVLLTAGMFANEIMAALPGMREFLPPEMYGKVFLGACAVNILLRIKTNTALNNK